MVALKSLLASVAAMVGVVTLVATPAEAVCSYGTRQYMRDNGMRLPKFSYSKRNGPLEWYRMNKTENRACALGRVQSPINLFLGFPTEVGFALRMRLEFYPEGTEIQNIGTTIILPANGTMVYYKKPFNLVQIHFHAPGEHRIKEEHWAMEMHLVFESPVDDQIGIIAYMLGVGKPEPLFTNIFLNVENIKRKGTVTMTGPISFKNIQTHIDERLTLEYEGSLTTPPCTEGTQWFVVERPMFIEDQTYERVKKILKANARPLQNRLGDTNLLQKAALDLIKS